MLRAAPPAHRAHPCCAALCSLGNEFGAVHKPWDSAEIRFALTYPEIYEGALGLGRGFVDALRVWLA